jgi:glycosyltransferase involved in cell wall biosynthesis
MNILHVNTKDAAGGAARAMYRLHTGLGQLGHTSRILVGRKSDDGDLVREISPRGSARWIVDKGVNSLSEFVGLQYLAIPSTRRLPREPWWQQAEVVNLHNTHGGYFDLTALPGLSRRKPLIWTLHDMWAFTGHCAYDMGCGRWPTGCGACPRLHDELALRWDTTALLWRLKKWIYARSQLTIVTPSRWLANLVRSSPLLDRFDVHCIPNSVDTGQYAPLDRALARQALALPQDLQLIMFSSEQVDNQRKGGQLLERVVARLVHEQGGRLGLLVLGAGGERWKKVSSVPAYDIGTVFHERMIALCYAAADVFVLPTLADNLPNVLLEGMACGTPCVSFDVGGVGEVVRHMQTGYLARPGDEDDLLRGIELLLVDDEIRRRLSANAREVALTEYTLGVQAHRYAELYSETIKRSARRAS